jgi:hypothetical protein
LYAHKNNCKKQLVKEKIKKERKKERKQEKTAEIGINVRARGFNAGLPARSHFASGRSCDRPTQSSFSVVLFSPRAIAELVPKFLVELHASHTALPMVTLNISPCTSVTLT